MTINNAELTSNLKSCSSIFVEKLIVSFGDEAIKELENTPILKDKRELLERLILESDDDTKQGLYALSIQEFAEFVVKNEASLKASRDKARDAREAYNKDKEAYKTNTQVKIDALDEDFEIDQDKLASYQLKLNKVKAKELREKTRHRGLVALAKGTIAATIDGIEDRYMRTANAVMASAINDTKASMRNFQNDGVDVDTIEGTKAIEEAVIAKAKKTSKDTQAGKNDSMLSQTTTLAAKAAIILNHDINSKFVSDTYQEIEKQRNQEIRQAEEALQNS